MATGAPDVDLDSVEKLLYLIAFQLHFNCNAIVMLLYCIAFAPYLTPKGHNSIFSQFSGICTAILMGRFIPLSCLTCFSFAYYYLILLSLHNRDYIFTSYAFAGITCNFVSSCGPTLKTPHSCILLISLLFHLQNQYIFCSSDLLCKFFL